MDNDTSIYFKGEGWKKDSVTISIPTGKQDNGRGGAKDFVIEGLYHRSITALMTSIYSSDPASLSFHHEPFKQYWQPPGTSSPTDLVRTYDEIFTSDAMIEEHEKLQNSPLEPGCSYPRVIAALMLWSDATHMAQFGTASLHPAYSFWGNQSKWLRGKPNARAGRHLSYFPSVE
jgi:hypothetical protein